MSEGTTAIGRLIVFALGAALAAAGAGILYHLFSSADASDVRSPLEAFTFIAPAMVVVGTATALNGLLLGKTLSPAGVIRLSGLLMLLLGAFPWAYTPWLTGDRAGGESAGMLGTIIFLRA
ncbi:hypothetical protein HS125_20325 [bacterium]|nr:hypothetical protein [bacterium]